MKADPFSLKALGFYNSFELVGIELLIHNYENLKILKNRQIGGISSKKGMSLESLMMLLKCSQMIFSLFEIGLESLRLSVWK